MTESAPVLVRLAGYADEYRTRTFDSCLGEFDLDRRQLLDADPRTSLQFFYRLYGFNRSIGMQAGYQHKAVSALEQTESRTADGTGVDPDELWENFVTECERTDTGVNERTNRGVVRGAARLANREGNLFRWVGREVDEHGRLTVPYDELTSIDGIGSSIARFFLRDAVWLNDAEDGVRRQDGRLLQSVTRWVELVAGALWPPLDGADTELLTDRIVIECADEGVSLVEFNQGAWYFAREEMDGDPERIRSNIRDFREDDR